MFSQTAESIIAFAHKHYNRRNNYMNMRFIYNTMVFIIINYGLFIMLSNIYISDNICKSDNKTIIYFNKIIKTAPIKNYITITHPITPAYMAGGTTINMAL